MNRLDLHLKPSFIAMMVILGCMSFGFVPLVIWLMAARHYPKALDSDGITLRTGEKLLWRDLTEKKRMIVENGRSRYVAGVGLKFGKKNVQIAPAWLAEGPQVLPYVSRVLGEDLTAA